MEADSTIKEEEPVLSYCVPVAKVAELDFKYISSEDILYTTVWGWWLAGFLSVSRSSGSPTVHIS